MTGVQTCALPIFGRYGSRKLGLKFVTPDYFRYRVTNDRVARVRAAFEKTMTEIPVNTDLRPSTYRSWVVREYRLLESTCWRFCSRCTS